MASTFTPNAGFEKPSHGDQAWDAPLRRNFDISDSLATINIALQVTVAGGLKVNVAPGQVQIGGSIYPFLGQTALTLSPNTTNFVFVSNVGVITFNVSGFPSLSVPLARVFTGPANVISVVDTRSFLGGPGGAVSSGVNTLAVTGAIVGLQGDIVLVSGSNIVITQDTPNNKFLFDVNGGSINRKYRQPVSGSLDGFNNQFTTPDSFTAGTEEIFIDGVLRNFGAAEDYTLFGANGLSFTFAPAIGSKILASYNSV
jgi:hypothetical protein